jgi:MtN3 and saliva related transmembrane protein
MENMDLQSLLGPFASLVTVASFVPQVIKAWRSQSVKDVSYGMIILLLFSGILWAWYGVLISDVPVILTNIAVATLNIAILAAKVRYRAV